MRLSVPGCTIEIRSGSLQGAAIKLSIADAILVLNDAERAFWDCCSATLGNISLQDVTCRIHGSGKGIALPSENASAFFLGYEKASLAEVYAASMTA